MADTVELQGVSGWLRGHSNWEDLVLFPSPGLLETPTFGNLGYQPDSEVVEKVLSDLAGH